MKPQAWNSGAANIVGSRARSGIRDSTATIGSIGSGVPREAPFGVPVLPEVSRVILPGRSGIGMSLSSLSAISRSSEFSSGAPSPLAPSCQASQRWRSPTAPSISSANSSS